MIKWILIGSLFYFFYKAFVPMLSIFKFGQSIKEKKKNAIGEISFSKRSGKRSESEKECGGGGG